MLNPFPIQFLALGAYLILRVFMASVLIYLGVRHLTYRQELTAVFTLSWFPFGGLMAVIFGLAEITVGLLLFVGASTQYAALVVIAMSLKLIVLHSWFKHHTIPPRIFYVLLLGAAMTLFITGAGALAFDLPL